MRLWGLDGRKGRKWEGGNAVDELKLCIKSLKKVKGQAVFTCHLIFTSLSSIFKMTLLHIQHLGPFKMLSVEYSTSINSFILKHEE